MQPSPDVLWFRNFLSVAFSDSWCMSTSEPSSSHCNSFSCYLSIRPFSSVLSVPILYSQYFCFLCIWLILYLRAIATYLMLEFYFVILEYPVLFLLLDLVCVSFKLPFFIQYIFWFSSPCIVRLDSFFFVFLSFHPNISTRVFPSITILPVVSVSVPVLLA